MVGEAQEVDPSKLYQLLARVSLGKSLYRFLFHHLLKRGTRLKWPLRVLQLLSCNKWKLGSHEWSLTPWVSASTGKECRAKCHLERFTDEDLCDLQWDSSASSMTVLNIYRLNIVSPHNLHVKILTLSVMIKGGEALGRWLGHEGGAFMMGLHACSVALVVSSSLWSHGL